MDDQVSAYVERVAGDRRVLLERLRTILLDAFPDAQELLWWNMPTYRRGSGWVALGYRKDGATLYTDSPDHIAAFRAAHPRIRTGKACIDFGLTGELPAAAIVEVARHAFGSTARGAS